MLQYNHNKRKEVLVMNDVYRSVRDESTEIELLKVDERASTYMVKFLNGDKKGETTVYSKSTMKRWWRKVKEENHSTPMSWTKEPEKTKKNTLKKSMEKEISELKTFIEDNYKNKWYSSVKCYKILNNKEKPLAEIYPQKKKISCYFHSLDGKDLDKVLFHKDGYRYYLQARVDISYDSDFISILNEFLKEE